MDLLSRCLKFQANRVTNIKVIKEIRNFDSFT